MVLLVGGFCEKATAPSMSTASASASTLRRHSSVTRFQLIA